MSKYKVGAYIRLSRDDKYSESDSIDNQKKVIEQYAVDISKKVSSIKHMQQEKGDFIGVSAPYGYLKDPNDCHKFIVDKYAANIVRRIFDMTLECKSRNKIADILNKEKILTPSKYKTDITGVTSKNTITSNKWNGEMISKILKNETYIGTLIQGKFKKKSRKQKRMIKTDKEEWKIVENHHEGIIDKDKFNAVQNIIDFSYIVQEEDELLISRLECDECHSGFYRKKSKGYYYYICKSRYRKLGCNLSPIRKDILENMILIDINDKFKKNYKSLNKNIVNQFIDLIIINDKNEIKVVYKN